MELQSAERNYGGECEKPAAGVGLGDERGRRDGADADCAQRHHLPFEHQQHGAGARRKDRGSDLGKPCGAGIDAGLRGHAQPFHLGRQSVPFDDRRAAVCAQRAQRGDSLAERSRAAESRLQQHGRQYRDQRQGAAGADGLHQLQGRRLLYQWLRRGHRQAAVEVQHGGARRAAGRRYVGQAAESAAGGRRYVDYGQLRSGTEPDVLGHFSSQAVAAGEPGFEGGR